MGSSSYLETSAPATTALPPALDNTMTRTSGSASKRSTASPMPRHISSEIALSLSGLLKTICAIAPVLCERMVSVMSMAREGGSALVEEGGECLAVVGGLVRECLECRRELQDLVETGVLSCTQQPLDQAQRLRRMGPDCASHPLGPDQKR